MRFKHNKKRNTAFLFEALVRELTSAIISKQHEKKAAVIEVLKEHFGKGTALYRELEIYKSLYKTEFPSEYIAERTLFEAKNQYAKLDKNKIFLQQGKLISDINKSVNKRVYHNFVPNYKSLANIYQCLNRDLAPKKKVLLESSIIKSMCMSGEVTSDTALRPADSLILRSFIKKFNEAYGTSLFEEQKSLLNKYVSSFADNGLELKIFLNEEIPRLKEVLESSEVDVDIKLNDNIRDKTKKVLSMIGEFKERSVDSAMVEQVLKIQNLAREIQQ